MKILATILTLLAISSCTLKYRGHDGQYNPNKRTRTSNVEDASKNMEGDSDEYSSESSSESDEQEDSFYQRSGKRNLVENEMNFSLAENSGMDDFSRYSLIANNYFNAGNIGKAKTLFEYIKNSMLIEPLWFETCYSLAECHISENNFQPALNELESILIYEEIPKEIREKALIRAGQIECILGNKVNSSKYFITLRKEFPKSIYLPLADCNKIK